MSGLLKGLTVTLRTMLRSPETAQYPEPDKRLVIEKRFMGFPALMWDYSVNEPHCTACTVCVRQCPTQCMSAKMKDNPQAAEGKSKRRKIVAVFEINLARCIVCGICASVCNFDAIVMTHEHEKSKYLRDGNRLDLQMLLEMGKQFQEQIGWEPKQAKNIGKPEPSKSGAVRAKPKAASRTVRPARPPAVAQDTASEE